MKFFIFLTLMGTLLWAQERSFYFKHTNDLLFGVDRDYSTGTEIGVTLGQNSYALQQDIYTPDRKYTSQPIQGEHPYAGWLCVKAQHNYQLEGNPSYIALSLGTVGERSRAKEVQRFIHDITYNDEVKGWDSQHKNQYGYILELYNRYQTPFISPFGRLSLGGIDRYVELGMSKESQAILLKRDFKISTTLSSRYVDKNIFLEKDRNGYSVEKKDFMASISITLNTNIGGYLIEMNTIINTRAYHGQKLPYGYSSLKLSIPF